MELQPQTLEKCCFTRKWPDGSYSKLFASSFVYSEIVRSLSCMYSHPLL
jgi:hypothetical protein